ncbi:hypothetical protein [Rossellomorea aquimaris]|nr:hypothetical protein [Rossellomorea aquimaris]
MVQVWKERSDQQKIHRLSEKDIVMTSWTGAALYGKDESILTSQSL